LKYLFEEVDIDSVTFNPYNSDFIKVDKQDAVNSVLRITEDIIEDLKTEIDKIIDYKKTAVEKGKWMQSDNYLLRIPHYFAGKKMVPEKGCFQPRMGLMVNLDGLIVPCWGDPFFVANVKQYSLRRIVASRRYDSFVRRAEAKECKGCLAACYSDIY
jgi:hypothetical protein